MELYASLPVLQSRHCSILRMKWTWENHQKKGYLFGTLADFDTLSNDMHVTTLFNKDFEVVTGSERIGRKFNMAFVYAHIRRPKRGYYEVEFKELNPTDLATNPYAYTDEFVRLLEANIKESPELWLQWSEPRF